MILIKMRITIKEAIKIGCGSILRILLYLTSIIPKDNKTIIFGAWYGKKYADNSKALFEYASKHTNYNCIWITNSKELRDNIKHKGYKAEVSTSGKGIIAQMRAIAAFSCTGKYDFNRFLLGGCIHIELWHGVGGGKKIGYDDIHFRKLMELPRNNWYKKIEKYPYRHYYQVCTSEEMKRVFSSAFRLKDNQFIMAGQPRNDMFFDPNYRISSFDTAVFVNKRVILYLPTHRLEGKMKMNCSELFDLKELNRFCERNNCIFLIKKHFYHKSETENLESYSHIIDWTQLSNIDTNELLMIADYLISDYSSVTADYLLLNRPIFYYCFDLKRYLEKDREMYWPYVEITPGRKAESFDELLYSLKYVIEDGVDEYIDDRERVLSMFYGQQARKMVSNDIMNAVKKILDDNNHS